MIILRYKNFSAIKDEAYEEKMKNKKKQAARRALALGALGAVAGGVAGHYNWEDPVLTGMSALAGAGAAGLGGAIHMDNVNGRVKKKLQKYRAADEKDKAFLRQLEKLPQ